MLKRLVSFFCIICVMFVGIVGRICYITENQVLYSTRTSNKISLEIDASRGDFYDRNNEKLTSTTRKYVAIIKPDEKVIGELSGFFDSDKIKDIVKKLQKGYPIIEELPAVVPSTDNIQVVTISERYDDKQLLSHIIGSFSNNSDNNFGLEKSYNDFLTTNGSLKISYYVDAKGRMLSGDKGTLSAYNYDKKKGIVLTIDKNIQRICEDAVDNSKTITKGSVVVLDIKSGEILAMVSRPNLLPDNLNESLNDENSPFINRSLNEYTVGSVFKLVVASAAIENGLKDFQYTCTGTTSVESLDFSCKKEGGHGSMTLESALSMSCNTYFINLAQALGGDGILQMAMDMGFGKSDVLADGLTSNGGILPSANELNSKASLANFSFGQGILMATPLQIASMIGTIANDGVYNSPSLIMKFIDDDGTENQADFPIDFHETMSEKTAKKVRSFMVNTVENGTGKSAKPNNLSAGGKTATAQTGSFKSNGNEILHSWFGGFYPAEEPKYAIVVMNEDGTSGTTDCCPVFKEICDEIDYKID